ncbi:MAG: hypothetical protein ABSC51_01290 [Gaiellaceae bacterium]|jgi:hypothetical protein
MSDWDEAQGPVSRAFNDWYLTDRDQRAFLHLGLRFSETMYEQLWQEVLHEPGDPEGDMPIDVFSERVDGLLGPDYDWMHLAGVIRDAVTNFEVYLEKAREEVLHFQGQPVEIPENSPKWWVLSDFFSHLGVDIEALGVKETRDLRHFLTHRRGELRTEKLRETYAATNSAAFGSYVIDLDEEKVKDVLDILGAATRSIDRFVWQYGWGGVRIELDP